MTEKAMEYDSLVSIVPTDQTIEDGCIVILKTTLDMIETTNSIQSHLYCMMKHS